MSSGMMATRDYSLKDYAAMSAMYWPGLDSTSYAAAYSQASALAAVANNFNGTTVQSNSSSSIASTPSIGSASPPDSQHLYPQDLKQTSLNHISTSSPQTQVATSLMAALAPSMTSSGVVHSTTPTTPPKKKAQSVPVHMKDDTYWDRRRRNNESARRSRESRRMKEDQIAMRVVYLEQENLQLRTEVGMLRAELDKMRLVLYSTTNHHQSVGMPH